MVFTFPNLFVLQEYVFMFMTSTIGTHFCLLSYENNVIDTINPVNCFLNFITDAQELYLLKYSSATRHIRTCILWEFSL